MLLKPKSSWEMQTKCISQIPIVRADLKWCAKYNLRELEQKILNSLGNDQIEQPTEIAASVSICFARALSKQSQPLPWGSSFRCDDGEVTILRNRFLKRVACITVRLKFKHQKAITDVCILYYYKNCSIWFYSDYYRYNSLLCLHRCFYSSFDRIRVSSLSRRVSRSERVERQSCS